MADLFTKVVYQYTRAQAIEDGVLIDISDEAKKLGIKNPIAVTKALFTKVFIPRGIVAQNGETSAQRISHMLVLFVLIACATSKKNMLFFSFRFINETGASEKQLIKVVFSGGDSGKPVITFMLSEED